MNQSIVKKIKKQFRMVFNEKGFTLFELLAVVVIMGVVAASIYPLVNTNKDEPRLVELQLESMKRYITSYEKGDVQHHATITLTDKGYLVKTYKLEKNEVGDFIETNIVEKLEEFPMKVYLEPSYIGTEFSLHETGIVSWVLYGKDEVYTIRIAGDTSTITINGKNINSFK